MEGVTPRAEDGTINTNKRFPDMKGLVDHIHSLGLKAGIYSGPGPTTCGGCTASYEHEEQDAKSYADWGFDYLKYDLCSYDPGAADWHDRASRDEALSGHAAKHSKRSTAIFSIACANMAATRFGNGGRKWAGNSWRTTGDITDRLATASPAFGIVRLISPTLRRPGALERCRYDDRGRRLRRLWPQFTSDEPYA